jgi:transcriptional regulator with XRE-family HTH domain
MGTPAMISHSLSDARAFGAYLRLLRENLYGKGRGKGLRQLARDAGIAPSVLSRGERGLQDLRRVEYIERIAPHLGVRPSVLKRVAALITPQDVEDFRRLDTGLGAADFRQDGASRLLWGQVTQELHRLRGATPETLETLLAYIEYLAARDGRNGAGTNGAVVAGSGQTPRQKD